MTYSTRLDTFTHKWILEKEEAGKIIRLATYSDEIVVKKVAKALNDRRIDVS